MAEVATTFARLLALALPFFVLGLVIAGLLEAFLPRDLIERWLARPGLRPILYSTLAGALLPGDVCLSMPLVSWLRRAGAGAGSLAAFLVSAPLLALEEIPLTYALLGPILTFARVASTITLGVAAGLLAPLALAPVAAPAMRSFAPDPRLPLVSVARAIAPRARLGVAASHALGLARRLLPYLLGGLLAASAFETLAPEGALAQLVPHSALQVLVAATIGLPLYLCEGEEVPLALALVAAGGTPGAALAFMIAGPGICTTSVAMVAREFGKLYASAYMGFYWVSAIAGGLLLDGLLSLLR